MSIGETLADARRWAGLSVTEVSRRTRIRETLVKDIERDDYSACGGDFYTRGHIRAIARVVGADPEPLIEEYDAARRAAPESVADTVPELPSVRTQGWPQPPKLAGDPEAETRERFPPGGSGGQPRPSEKPAAGAPLRITPDRPGGWQEPRRDTAAGAAPRVTPDRPGGRSPAGFSQDFTLVPPERPGGWQRRPEEPPDPPRPPAPDQVGGQPPLRIQAADVPPEVTHDRPGGWQQHTEPPGGRTAGGIYQYSLGGRRQRNWPVMFGLVLVVVLGFLGWYFVYGSGTARTGTPAASGGSQPAQAGGAHTVVVRLTAIRASTVVFSTPGGKNLLRAHIAAGASKRWTFQHAVTMRVTNPRGVRLLVDGKNPLPSGAAHPVTLNLSPGHPATVASSAGTPTPNATHSPAVPITTSVPLTPASATSFGVSGPGQGDNQQQAPLAIDSSVSTSWNTDWYASARFGNLYPGTGLLLDMGRPVTITSAEISLGSAPGATFQLRVGSAPTMAALPPAARATGASGVVRLRLTTPARGRYVLIWFTRLPLNSSGNYEASVYNVRVQGHV